MHSESVGLKCFYRMFLKHFIRTVYKPFHDECLKNFSSITFISLAIL